MRLRAPTVFTCKEDGKKVTVTFIGVNDPPALTSDERRKLDADHAVENDDETQTFLASTARVNEVDPMTVITPTSFIATAQFSGRLARS